MSSGVPLQPRERSAIRSDLCARFYEYYASTEGGGVTLCEQTQQHFRDGWFYPGDLAQQDAQGYLYLRGCSNDTVIRGGVNIYPSEIEATLLQLPNLLDCSVFGVAVWLRLDALPRNSAGQGLKVRLKEIAETR